MSAIPDSNPIAQLRLVVLGQWVRAGLDLVRRAGAGQGLVGGAVALWQVFQAVRLAIRLAQRLSELHGALSRIAPDAAPGGAPVQGSVSSSDDPAGAAACLRHALNGIIRSIRDALGLAAHGRPGSGAERVAVAATAPEASPARGRRKPPRERAADPPPRPVRWRARRRRPCAAGALDTALTPFAALADGRFRLAAG